MRVFKNNYGKEHCGHHRTLQPAVEVHRYRSLSSILSSRIRLNSRLKSAFLISPALSLIPRLYGTCGKTPHNVQIGSADRSSKIGRQRYYAKLLRSSTKTPRDFSLLSEYQKKRLDQVLKWKKRLEKTSTHRLITVQSNCLSRTKFSLSIKYFCPFIFG